MSFARGVPSTSSEFWAGPIDSTFEHELRSALNDANLPTVLAVVTHLTGNLSLLDGEFRLGPMRGAGDHDDGGLSDETAERLRDFACTTICAALRGELQSAELPAEAVVKILGATIGQQVPGIESGLLAEELGLVDRRSKAIPQPSSLHAPRVLIVGAGISGIGMAIRLKEAGIEFTMVDKNSEAGGTWWENTYPGVGVDTPVHLYSYSFAQRGNWPRYFARQGEVQKYVLDVAREHGVLGATRFETELIDATWDDDAQTWRVTLRGPEGEIREAHPVIITAVGQMNRPAFPQIPGLDEFDGRVVHTAQWDPGLSLEGKRVAVIGSGASAMQLVPDQAGVAKHITIYQRSPQWILPNPNTGVDVTRDKQFLMSVVPWYLGWYRLRQAWNFGDRMHPMLQIDPDWHDQSRSINEANDKHRAFLTAYIERQLEGREDLVAKCVPDYPPYGKRPLLDHGWFAALKRDDVQLVDSGVVAIEGKEVVAANGSRAEVDVVVLATGFKILDVLGPSTYVGRSGQTLRNMWGADDARAHLGITVPDFPNLFMLFGPNTNAGHGGSHFMSVELQIRYITQVLERMAVGDLSSVECRPEPFEKYNSELDEALSHTVWTHPAMTTYYRNSVGRIVTNTAWTNAEYWHRTREMDEGDFILRQRTPG